MDEQNLNSRIADFDNLEPDTNQDYISAINEIKANSVSKAAYDKLKAENKQLLDSLVSGKEINIETEKKSLKELQEASMKEGAFNIEWWENLLDLRDATIEAGLPDPALSKGNKVNGIDIDPDSAENIAQGIRELIEIADGDNAIFTREYQRVVQDAAIPRSTTRRR